MDFVSWHIYSSDPSAIRDTVTYVRGLLAGYPQLKVQTFLDEWNMDLTNPPLDPRFQPCFILETVWNMKEAGLDYSCYYHIRDYYVDPQVFGRFMSETGVAFMSRWWNRMPQFDGLFDYQNRVRPAYFAFKLLSRMGGERLELSTPEGPVRGFATRDAQYRMENLLVWNFDRRPVSVQVEVRGLSGTRRFRHIVLDSLANSDDENLRLRPDPFQQLKPESPRLRAEIEAYGVHYWSLE